MLDETHAGPINPKREDRHNEQSTAYTSGALKSPAGFAVAREREVEVDWTVGWSAVSLTVWAQI